MVLRGYLFECFVVLVTIRLKVSKNIPIPPWSLEGSVLDVLLIDDEKEVLEYYDFLIDDYAQKHKLDIAIKSVPDPIEASKILENQKFDLIVTDLHMPNKNGIDIIRDSSVANGLNAETHFIVITGYIKQIEDLLGKENLDRVHLLCKPIKPEKFENVFSLYLKSKLTAEKAKVG